MKDIVLVLYTILSILIFLLLYTYVGYPFLISMLARVIHKDVSKKNIIPTVSMIIAAHNEEACIRRKLQNSLGLNYPADKLEIIVASDCSTDNTNTIVREFREQGVKLCEQRERLGKTAAQIEAVRMAHGDILVFSDASTIYDKDALKELVRNFHDVNIGCVGGRVVLSSDGKETYPKDKNVVIDLEHTIRAAESYLFSTCVVSGCIYAVRKKYYREINYRIADDIGVPLDILIRGYKVVFEPNAIGYEDVTEHSINLQRNVRTINQGWVALELLNFFGSFARNPARFLYVSFILFSHKVLRWLTFVILLVLLVFNVIIVFLTPNSVMRIFLVAQAVFYLLAVAGWFLKGNRGGISIFAYEFCLYHYAAFLAFKKFIKGEWITIWN